LQKKLWDYRKPKISIGAQGMKKRKKKNATASIYDLTPLEKAIAIGIVGVGGFITYKVIKDQVGKMNMRADIRKFKTQTLEDLNINLAEIAKQVYDSLGIGFIKIDPRNWNENEEAATLAILKVPKPFIGQLEKVYQQNHKRNLREDLQSFLDDYWYQVRHLFV
jgi:hypothetical protein